MPGAVLKVGLSRLHDDPDALYLVGQSDPPLRAGLEPSLTHKDAQHDFLGQSASARGVPDVDSRYIRMTYVPIDQLVSGTAHSGPKLGIPF
jgi:hypothetical protein